MRKSVERRADRVAAHAHLEEDLFVLLVGFRVNLLGKFDDGLEMRVDFLFLVEKR